MKRGVRFLIGVVATVLALGAMPASAGHESGYLALGDSYAFAYNPTLNPTDASNFVGYADIVGRALAMSVSNAACPGETSGSLISGTPPDNGCHEFYPVPLPRHVAYTGSQLGFAINYLRENPDVRLVTLQVGGNDVLILEAACGGNTACILQGLPAVEAQLAANLSTIYRALREQAHYRHTIVDVSYFAFNYNDPNNVGIVSALDGVEAAVAMRYHARVANVLGAFAAASSPTGVPCFAGLQVVLRAGPPPSCDIHPSLAGHRVYARAILAVVPRGEPED